MRVDAFDVIGEMTFSKQLGFLREGRDVEGVMESLEKMFDYAGKVRCMRTVCVSYSDRSFVRRLVRCPG